MHIAIIADPIDKQMAGIHYLTKHLVSNLSILGKKNTYSIIRFKKEPDQLNIKTIILKNTLPFLRNDPVRTFITLPLLLKKLNPDVVIETAHFGPFNLPKNIKRITIIHDLSPIKFPKFHPFLSRFLQRFFLPGIIKRADLLISNSKNTSLDLKTIYPESKGKIVQIYLGKEDFFKPKPAEDIFNRYQIKKPFFLNIGTIEPRKNLITLLNAFTLFKQAHKSKVQLVIAGSKGWKNHSFFQKLKSHPYREEIKLLGYVDRIDLPALYSNAAAFIYPSFYEGFGLPVLEAMACGAPCIVSNSSSLPEVGGDAVLYFDPHHASELKDQMLLVHHNKALQNSLKEIAITQASRFSWEKYAEKFIQELEINFAYGKNLKPGQK